MNLQTFSIRRLLRKVTAGACLTFAAIVAMASPARAGAQEMEVPVAIQVPLFLKVLTFDRLRMQNPEPELAIGITYQPGYRQSVSVRDEVSRLLRGTPGRKFRIVLIDLDRGALVDVLAQERIAILYVSPLRSFNISAIANAVAIAKVTTVTGVPQYVEKGMAVGVRLQGDRPRLLVNLTASRLGGADFTAELLKLAEVIQ